MEIILVLQPIPRCSMSHVDYSNSYKVYKVLNSIDWITSFDCPSSCDVGPVICQKKHLHLLILTNTCKNNNINVYYTCSSWDKYGYMLLGPTSK